ncbi:hypothetical protein CO229_01885 [Mycoplasmopsis bovirhinis]|uniref:hypothetical protein n=1 Tax=Mycoplasmopsis bovirhinis TaxID=29553 RepID=UPI000C059FA5|nr:hypothetical protein [Mycoplasmopsis bovirhinis]ATO30857.1 hypothetical protein CO229_01885 [Mycoplasmopsis bovirhinis]
MKLRKFTLITTNILTITTLGAVSCTSEQKPKDPTPQPDPNVTAANSFKTTHSEVLNKTISNITLPDEAKVTAALNAYNKLEQAVKNNLTSQKTLLDNLNAKILQLKQAQNKPEPAPDQTETAANNFKNAHATVLAKTVDTLALEDETNVNNALDAFNNLEQNVKDKLTSEKTLLDQLVAKIADLKEQAKNNQGTGEAEQPQRNTGPNFGGTDQFGGDPANPVTLNLFEFSEADDLGARFDKLLKEYLAKDAQKNDQRLKQMQIYGPTNETNQQVYLSIQGSGGKPETALLKLKEGFEVAKLEGTVNNQKKKFIAEFNTETRVLKITYKYDNKEYYDSLTIPAAKPATPSQETQNNQDTQVPKETTPSTEQPKQEEENKSTETQNPAPNPNNPNENNTQNNGGTSGGNTDGNTQVTQNTENTQSDANKGASSSTQADAPDQSGTASNSDNLKSNNTEQVAQETNKDTSANNQEKNKSTQTTKESEQKLVETQLKFESLTVIKDTNKRYIIFNVTSSKDLYEKIKDKDFKYILNKGNLEADDTTNGSNLKTRKLSESNGKVTFQIFPSYPWEDGIYTLTNFFDIKESNYNLLNKNYKFTLTSDNVVMDSN